MAKAEYDQSVCAVFKGGLDAVLGILYNEGESEW